MYQNMKSNFPHTRTLHLLFRVSVSKIKNSKDYSYLTWSYCLIIYKYRTQLQGAFSSNYCLPSTCSMLNSLFIGYRKEWRSFRWSEMGKEARCLSKFMSLSSPSLHLTIQPFDLEDCIPQWGILHKSAPAEAFSCEDVKLNEFPTMCW